MMLCSSSFWHFEYVSDTQKRFLCFSIRHDLNMRNIEEIEIIRHLSFDYNFKNNKQKGNYNCN
jgi:hypothetical protein